MPDPSQPGKRPFAILDAEEGVVYVFARTSPFLPPLEHGTEMLAPLDTERPLEPCIRFDLSDPAAFEESKAWTAIAIDTEGLEGN